MKFDACSFVHNAYMHLVIDALCNGFDPHDKSLETALAILETARCQLADEASFLHPGCQPEEDWLFWDSPWGGEIK